MRYQTLDNIVRSYLMRKGYSIHWYLQALKHASDCLRELTFDSLQNIIPVVLPVSDTGSVDLPCDFVDEVKVGVPTGAKIRPMTPRSTINRLENKDSSGNVIGYTEMDYTTGDIGGITPWSGNYNDSGEYIGREFGFKASWIQDGYKVIQERGQIQLDQGLGIKAIYLEYINDGQNSDNATKVHPYAQATIEAYISWQIKEHNRSIGQQESQRAETKFENHRRVMRARISGLSKEEIVRSVRAGISATIKG